MINFVIISFYLIIFIIIFIATIYNYNKDETKIGKSEIKINKKIKLSNESKYCKMINQYDTDNEIVIPIGFNEKNEVKTISLSKTPNLLVIGTTGGGKSILLNNIIASLSIKYTKEDIRILTMDTSIVELSTFNSIPHYIKNTISYPKDIIDELDEIQKEINRRKNQKERQPLLVVIDDLYDICTYQNSIFSRIVQLLEESKDLDIYFLLTTDTPSEKIFNKELLELINGSIYLTLSPGEDEEFSLIEQLEKEDIDFITKIGNLIYIHDNIKEKLTVPEITEKEIKEIIRFYNTNKN